MQAAPHTIPIVVLAGQSNALNSAVSLGVMASVARQGGLLLQNAVIGTPLENSLDRGTGDWSVAGGELYASLVQQIGAYLDPNSPTYVAGAYLAGVVWVQGEADTWRAGASASYQSNLTDLAADLTDRFGTHEFVVSGLSDHAGVLDDPGSSRTANWNTVQAGQSAFAAETNHSVLVDPDQLATRHGVAAKDIFRDDGLHYSTGFGGILGGELADQVFATSSSARSAGNGSTILHATGTAGNDTFTINTAGWRQIFGASGNDTLNLGNFGQGVSVTGNGHHVLRVASNDAASSMILDLISVEHAKLTKFADMVDLDLGTINLGMGGGNDTLLGSVLADTIALDDGDDYFDGRAGNDRAWGGLGNDTLCGGSGADHLTGGMGSDRLIGGLGADVLLGEVGSDWIYGCGGRDRMSGGGGNDVLFGGADADVFVFAPSGGRDTVGDFQNGIDTMDLTGFRTNFSALRITTIGTDVFIDLPGPESITLQNFVLSAIDSTDFQF